MSYDDDNYGPWDEQTSDEDETKEYQRIVREESVKKECTMCGQTVYLMPHYSKCDSCCRKLEAGYQY